MFANSTPVHSNQAGPHPRLLETVRRHLQSVLQAPLTIPPWWAPLKLWWSAGPLPVLDLGCGCGESVRQLQQRDPSSRVLGIDASLHRLQRGGLPIATDGHVLTTDCGWLHGDAVSLLRLLAREGWRSPRICLLYPNPWPRSAHLRRRWHGHPVLVELLRVAQTVELRSNWALYLEEFAQATSMCGWTSQIDPVASVARPLSRFEHKYAASGHLLWRLDAWPPGDSGVEAS